VRAYLWASVLMLVLVLASPSGAAETWFWHGRLDGADVAWSDQRLDATRSGHTLLSAGERAAKRWEMIRADADAADGPLRFEVSVELLSALGRWLSLRETSFCDCGGAHPSESAKIVSYDLAGDPADGAVLARLDRIFPPGDVLRELLRNNTVLDALGGGGEPPLTLPELERRLAYSTISRHDCAFFFEEKFLSAFAFHHVANGRIAVRLGLPAAVETCRGELTEIELLLPMPEALRAAVATGDGLLMGRDDTKSTTFAFGGGNTGSWAPTASP
jgi:hypothetical protein